MSATHRLHVVLNHYRRQYEDMMKTLTQSQLSKYNHDLITAIVSIKEQAFLSVHVFQVQINILFNLRASIVLNEDGEEVLRSATMNIEEQM